MMLRQSNSASDSHLRSIARPLKSKGRILPITGGGVSEETYVVATTCEIDGGGLRTFMQKHPEIAELKKFIREENQDTRRHFEVVAENIQQDVAGANADEISLIKDKQLDHEQRITALEPH